MNFELSGEQVMMRDSTRRMTKRDIRPILSDKCSRCHGPDANQRKEDLRLDRGESAYAALKDYEDRHAIVPGNPEASEVYFRISTDDTSLVMPPPSSYMSLTDTVSWRSDG